MSSPKRRMDQVEKEPFKFSTSPNLEDIRELHAEFSDERDWNKFHTPRNLLLAMVGEVGEVAELFQWRGEVADGLPDWTAEDRTALEEELSDVLIYLVRLADKCRIDLPSAVLRKIEINRQKYPADQVMGSSKKYTEYKSPNVTNGRSPNVTNGRDEGAEYNPLQSMQMQINGLNIRSTKLGESSSDESNTESPGIVRMAKRLEKVQFLSDCKDDCPSSTPDSE